MNTLNKITVKDTWIEKLKITSKPIFLYGIGNGADKILDLLKSNNINVEGIFVSDEFYREKIFRDYRLQKLSDVTSKYGDDIIVLLSFGSKLDELYKYFLELNDKYEFYIPYVPLFGDDKFDYSYYVENKCQIEKVYNLLSDEKSKTIYENVILFRLTGNIKYLSITESLDDTLKSLFNNNIESVIDAGAFIGDTAKIFKNSLKNDILIYPIEPDARAYNKLVEYANSTQRIKPINSAVNNNDDDTIFYSTGGRSSSITKPNTSAKTITVKNIKIDTLVEKEKIIPDLIKYDVEGYEKEALDGSLNSIDKYSPSMIISIYHKTSDIFSIPLSIINLNKNYRYFIRRIPCIPDWDIEFIAINEKHLQK